MLYYLFDYLGREYDLAGAGLFQYLSFRAGMAAIVSLLIAIIFGKKIIRRLYALQVGKTIRDLGLQGQNEKAGTPTMGGVIIKVIEVQKEALYRYKEYKKKLIK